MPETHAQTWNSLAELRSELAGVGAKEPHLIALTRTWLQGRRLVDIERRRFAPLPRSVDVELAGFDARLDAVAKLDERHGSGDGSQRVLLRLSDGQSVESVFLPRRALCVSSQIGCAVGCRFCMTGRSGLIRQASSLEILAQVVQARRAGHEVHRVVFMGMGEPSHNMPALREACRELGGEGHIPHKHLVFSTVGHPSTFAQLRKWPVRPALALSLHSCDDELRRHLLPRAPKVAVRELLAAAHAYAREITWPVQVQWTLLRGVNDSDAAIDALAQAMQGVHGMVNVIPFNEVEGLDYERPSWERGGEIVQRLRRAGLWATIRQSSGQDVDGACGQLRARAAAE
ncbi:MAG: rRNA methyltransferase [Planctomycetota bacterium]|nr:MAG: rRNA methyltransferase [Planctomycetota bacterium]